jgi:hypothetical protein
MRRFLKLIPILALVVLLGCSRGQTGGIILPSPVASPSPGALLPTQGDTPSPASVIPLNQTTATLQPILSNTPSATPIPPTINPTYLNFPSVTPSATLDPSKILLRIVAPGPMSKVVSPVEFIIHIAPDYTGSTSIELIGEDGTVLYGRYYFKTYSNIGYYTRVDEKINFEINGAAEVARLQVSTFDEKKHLKAFNSVRVLLQSVGENEFTPPYAVQDRIHLQYPKKVDEIAGGTLPVMGEFQPANDKPIILELIDMDGNVIGSRILQLGPADGKYQQFATIIPYQLAKKTQARLIIRQSDDRIDGLAYLFSIKFSVSP